MHNKTLQEPLLLRKLQIAISNSCRYGKNRRRKEIVVIAKLTTQIIDLSAPFLALRCLRIA